MLVSSLLEVSLDKAHTRADWRRRPLAAEELRYAADDVIYLCRIYSIMVEKLAELGRTDWLQEDFAALEKPELYDNPPENAWMRIRGLKKLTDSQLSVLQAVTRWRETTAQREDCPLPRLLRDELVFDFARLQPETGEEMLKIRGINQRVVKLFGRELGQIIKVARVTPPAPLAESAPAGTPRNQKQEALVDILHALVRIRAEENLLTPATLATRSDLEALLGGDGECRLLKGWRCSMVGRDLQALLRGEVLLKVENGCLRFA
jgi:ribonuclease D